MKQNIVTRALRIGVAMFAACIATLNAWADEWTDGDGNVWTFTTNGVAATVTAVSFETTRLTIPETLGGNPVTAFTAATFAGQTRAVRVTIPATVTAIPASAFENCGNLKAVTIQGEGLTSIGAYAFKGCGNLEAFVMPNSVTSLGRGVFSGCSSMVSVTLSDGLTELTGVPYGDGNNGYSDYEDSTSLRWGNFVNGLFYNCTSLKTISWGANIKTIGDVAFLNCSALEAVDIPDTVTRIGNHAFLGCSSLANVKIGDGVTTIGRMAFRALPNLTKVTFGAKVNEIQQQAFQDCVNLQNFTLPDTIQYLRFRCFAGCNKALTVVTIPTNKDELETELGRGVFSGCSKLATVTFGDTVRALTGVPYGDGNIGYGDYDDSTSLRWGNFVNGLFYNCTSLKTINWGNGIKTIGDVAFLNCSALEAVEIPDTVTSIGCHAFLGCSGLVNVKIGNGVTKIWRMAFRALPNLTKVTFGAKVNEIDQQAFQDCVNLQNFTLPDTIQYLRFRCFAGCNKALTAVTIPTNKDELETELGRGVFSGCSKLATVTFGDTVRALTGVPYGDGNIGYGDYDDSTSLRWGNFVNGLFYNCTSLKTINWGNSIKTIGDVAFLNCSALTDIVIPATITDIGNHAFFGCSSLRTVTVMGNVNSIGRYAFGNCNVLHYADFRGATMTSAPGYMPFAFDRDVVTVYAAPGSTGWTGVAEVEGLPESGMWGGALIAYGPPPADAGNPYDFYVYSSKATVSRTDYYWSMMVTTNRYVHGRTVPQSAAVIRQGDPVYLSYCFDEYWRDEAFDMVSRFSLSGTGTASFDMDASVDAHSASPYFWVTNATPDVLQDLAPGEYTLTLQLNGDNGLAETDYSNNSTSITFTVTARSRYTVTFDLNGADYDAPAPYVVYEGDAIGELPDPIVPDGWEFLGWYMEATGGEQVYASTLVMGDATCYAQWAAIPVAGSDAVTFDAQGGKFSNGARTKTVEATPGNMWGKLPMPAMSGYVFVGWYSEPTSGGMLITSSSLVPQGPATYYARWTKRLGLAAASEWPYEFTTDSWCGQGAVSHDGYDALRSGIIYDGQSSYLMTKVSGSGVLSFWWKVSSEAGGRDALRLLVDGQQVSMISGTADWTKVEVAVEGSGLHTIKWNYTKNGSVTKGEDFGWLDQIKWTASTSEDAFVFDANGGKFSNGASVKKTDATPGNLWGKMYMPAKDGQVFVGWYTAKEGGELVTSSSAVPNYYCTYYARWTPRLGLAAASEWPNEFQTDSWCGQGAVSYDGKDALRTGIIYDSQSSYLITRVTGAGTLTFWWKVSCEAGGNDALRFLLDGVQKYSISGEKDWAKVTVDVTGSGTHILKWNYTKNASVSKGQDFGWIDQMSWVGR